VMEHIRVSRCFGNRSTVQNLKPTSIEDVVQKYARFHVNPDQFDIAPTKPIPEAIERPMWMRPNMPKKYDNYEGLIQVTDAEEIVSRILG
jgi:hypothetical protein